MGCHDLKLICVGIKGSSRVHLGLNKQISLGLPNNLFHHNKKLQGVFLEQRLFLFFGGAKKTQLYSGWGEL